MWADGGEHPHPSPSSSTPITCREAVHRSTNALYVARPTAHIRVHRVGRSPDDHNHEWGDMHALPSDYGAHSGSSGGNVGRCGITDLMLLIPTTPCGWFHWHGRHRATGRGTGRDVLHSMWTPTSPHQRGGTRVQTRPGGRGGGSVQPSRTTWERVHDQRVSRPYA